MAGTQSKNTYEESLAGLMRNIADMKLVADANAPFLIDLETRIIGEYNSPQRKMAAAGMTPQPQANPMGMDALGLPGAMSGILGPGGGGPPPPPPMPGMAPPPSELGLGGMAGMPMPGPPMPQSAAEVGALV